jgi:hypothetical protein
VVALVRGISLDELASYQDDNAGKRWAKAAKKKAKPQAVPKHKIQKEG